MRNVSCPFADCSLQDLVCCRWGHGSWVLRCPAGLGGHCRGLGAEGLRTPNPASPRRRTRWEWVSGSGDPQPSSRAQGAKGSPAPLCPKSSGGLGAKTACVAFLSKGAVGLVLLREECFLSLCRLQHQGAGLVALGRQSLEAERPSLPRGHYWGLGLDGLRPPNPASP